MSAKHIWSAASGIALERHVHVTERGHDDYNARQIVATVRAEMRARLLEATTRANRLKNQSQTVKPKSGT